MKIDSIEDKSKIVTIAKVHSTYHLSNLLKNI